MNVVDICDSKAAQVCHILVVEAEMVVEEIMGHGTMGRQWHKVDISRNHIRFCLGEFNHHFTDNIDRGVVNMDFHSISCTFFIVLTIRDVPGNRADLQIEAFVVGSSINDVFHGVTAVHGGGKGCSGSQQKECHMSRESHGYKERSCLW